MLTSAPGVENLGWESATKVTSGSVDFIDFSATFFFLLVYQAENWSQMRACHVNIKQANNAQAEKFPAVILLENEIRSTKHVIS